MAVKKQDVDDLDGNESLSRSTVPVPDPTLLTTKQLTRELFALRELLESRLAGTDKAIEQTKAILEARIDGIDKMTNLLEEITHLFPARIDEKITALREVHEQKFESISGTHSEKFASIQKQFIERDTRSEQTSRDSKTAVDAALQAAKEAVGEQNKSSAMAISKSETSTVKQIDQLAVLINAMGKSFDDKIEDVKERLTRSEGKGAGMAQGWIVLVGVVSLIGTICGVVALAKHL